LICDNSDFVPPEEEAMTREVSDALFSSYPVPLPEQEATRAALGVPQDCTSTATVAFNVPLQKHRKNQTALAMSQVCRNWRQRLVCLKRLWRVIAFDTNSEPASVRLATLFFSRIEYDDVLVHVYAGFSLDNLVDPAVASLLSSLRDRADRWERFLYWGRLGQYRRYLDVPAPRLRWFSDNRDISHLYYGRKCQLFAGHTPTLQCLVTSTLGGWTPAALTNLNTLHLRVCDASLTVEVLLNVLRSTLRLEEFKLASPTALPHGCTACETVDLHHLRSIRLFNPHFRTILAHLRIPNVRFVDVSSVHPDATSGLEVGPAFQAPHPFIGLHSMPMLNRSVSSIHFSVHCSLARFFLTIDVHMEADASVTVNLSWIGGQQIHQWKGYFERSIAALARMQIAACPVLTVIAGFPFDYTPLLLLPAVTVFAFAGDLRTLLQALTDRDEEDQTSVLPNLGCLFAFEEVLTEITIRLIPPCLQFRMNLIIVFDAINCTRLVETLGPDYVVNGEPIFLAVCPRL
jgi:hypothetical protein